MTLLSLSSERPNNDINALSFKTAGKSFSTVMKVANCSRSINKPQFALI